MRTTMPKFFSVSDNSFQNRGFPWISTLTEGFGLQYYCECEKRNLYYATGKMVAKLSKNKGSKWPDILGCGHYPFMIVSEKVIECCKKREYWHISNS
jgi:hypothetical protein